MEFLRENVILVTVAVMVFVFVLTIAAHSSKWPYVPVGALMTPAELNFYHQLVRVIPNNTLIFTKVRIADVVDVKGSIKGPRRLKYFNPIAAKHLDFVVVDSRKMTVLAAIEVNDSSHDRADRRERDLLIRKVMEAAKVRLFEVKATKTYNLRELSEWLQLAAVGHVDEKHQVNTETSQQQPKHTEVGHV